MQAKKYKIIKINYLRIVRKKIRTVCYKLATNLATIALFNFDPITERGFHTKGLSTHLSFFRVQSLRQLMLRSFN